MENGHAGITSTSNSEAEAFDGRDVKPLSANTVCSFDTGGNAQERDLATKSQCTYLSIHQQRSFNTR